MFNNYFQTFWVNRVSHKIKLSKEKNICYFNYKINHVLIVVKQKIIKL